jgi:hypothetical protein
MVNGLVPVCFHLGFHKFQGKLGLCLKSFNTSSEVKGGELDWV